MRYGLSWKKKTIEEIGTILEATRERIRQAGAKSFLRLGHFNSHVLLSKHFDEDQLGFRFRGCFLSPFPRAIR